MRLGQKLGKRAGVCHRHRASNPVCNDRMFPGTKTVCDVSALIQECLSLVRFLVHGL